MLKATKENVEAFAEDVGLLWATQQHCEALDVPPSSFHFLRDFVATSRPCIIRRGTLELRLSLDGLVQQHPDLDLTVDVTPDGHGDCIRRVLPGSLNTNDSRVNENAHQPTRPTTMFVQPEERTMTLREFRDGLRSSKAHLPKQPLPEFIRDRVFEEANTVDVTNEIRSNLLERCGKPSPREEVLYYSRQNDCLRKELGALWRSLNIPESIPWAEEAFGTGPPDAINLWIGNEQSVSSMHKDHYENLYYVASGEKIFTLCPPADAPFLYERSHDSGRFVFCEEGGWKIHRIQRGDHDNEPTMVQWIATDITQNTAKDSHSFPDYPLLRYTHPRQVLVRAGEMLYLPALWFHRVTQTSESIAINYWYDMKFDTPGWCYFHLLQQMLPMETTQDER